MATHGAKDMREADANGVRLRSVADAAGAGMSEGLLARLGPAIHTRTAFASAPYYYQLANGVRLGIGCTENPAEFACLEAAVFLIPAFVNLTVQKPVAFCTDLRNALAHTAPTREINMTKRVAIYARVSTDGQTTDNQVRELTEVARQKGWTIAGTYIDQGISGAKGRDQRPDFDRLHKDAARAKFDLVMSWSVDRLGRSLQDLVGFLAELQSLNVGLFLHQQALDTTTPAGKAMFGMLGVFAEFERSMIQARVRSGLDRAREKGTKSGKAIGRPRTKGDIESAIRAALAAPGRKGLQAIAKQFGVGTGTVQRISATMEAA